MGPEFVFIGKIVRPQGHRGELRVMPLTDYPQRFDLLSRVFIVKSSEPPQEIQIERVRYQGNLVILKLSGIQTMNEAYNLVGARIAIPESEAVPLPADTYFKHQLLKLEVYSDEGEFLGLLEEIMSGPGNDVYIVRQGEREILLPAVKEVIKRVDLAGKRMTVHLIPGLKNPDAV